MSLPSAIQTENLTSLFGDTRALDTLTLEVSTGIIFGFLGPNGADKTTTIGLLLGLLEPTEGGATVWDLTSAPSAMRFAPTRAPCSNIRASTSA